MSMKVTEAQHAPSPAAGQATLSGTATLLRFMLRRDRIRTSAWVLGIGLLGFYFANAIQLIAETEDELRAVTAMFADPIGRMMTGPGFGMENPTHEALFSAGYVLYLYILIALFSVFTVIRHTRVEEQTGRAELIRANVVGRHATLTAALILTVVANLVAAVLIYAAGLVGDFPAEGSALVAIGGFAVGLFFAGTAAVTAQLSESSRGASGMAGAVIGLAFLIRMGGDAAEVGGNALSWFSPLAWSQQTAPYVEDRWWPLVLPVAFAAVLVWLGYALSTKRDVGASLLPTRLGRASAKPSLGTPLGLATHTLKGGLRGWGIALLLTGLMFGSFAQTMVDAADDLPAEMAQIMPGENMMLGYLAYMAVFMAVFIGAAGVSGLQQLRGEENRGRAEYAMSAPVGRTAWMGAHLTVLVLGVLLILVLVGLGMGLGAVASLEEDGGQYFSELLLAGIMQAPAVLALIGIVTSLLGWLPKLAGAVGWVFVGFGGVMSTFGQLLELPEAVLNLNIFGHLAEYPVEDIDWTPVGVLIAIGAVGIAIGLVGFNRREVNRV
ncbi:hypothetical protein HGQ17_04030 [Nesterenkonia sp. MY13]|uniref:ABC transporter permease n=1 Tax=Nesterenkonia sedimenti TaxID=1463632 RepID=A0A7X8TI50_9MICC|nr:hypothetical protein [Nesterenkonia sedimenti]NLS09185.1 hypothetical protein [Nesterenkonia sedimenti]